MRQVTVHGLGFAPEGERRCTIVPIHHAPNALTVALVDEWGDKTAQEAYEVLKRPDVKVTNPKDNPLATHSHIHGLPFISHSQVTNQKDKDVQLPKLLKLHAFAKHVVAENLNA